MLERERLAGTAAVAALALVDFAMTTLLEACVDSTFDELRKRADRILADESFHQRYVEGRLRELGSSPRRPVLEDELAALLPETLCWFGPPGEPGLELLVAGGIVAQRQRGCARLRSRVLGAADAGVEHRVEQAMRLARARESCRGSEWSSLERRLTASRRRRRRNVPVVRVRRGRAARRVRAGADDRAVDLPGLHEPVRVDPQAMIGAYCHQRGR